MNFWKRFKKEWQPKEEPLPIFTSTKIVRYRYHFTGTVQNVGFRYEVWKRASELQLGGYVRNNPDGSVTSELEGTEDKIDYLIASMQKIPRIHIEKIKKDPMDVQGETDFEMT